ncbi:helix-turn-helix domain-containing protein [Maledivibacter halophilus]|uniref:Transcriptional regulator, XRE family with cupin sensor n=1 Tax=Maledivibacter halophilus TaxID=36842 RepID=A0A1T5LYP1_9FIRM|nr:XRE family transcriptional regulator [Maledivibacter halophilus]SKC81120.1 transcriptional regulator, XRE family with cupin sensor [Maledivibacter halophilus]
MIGSKIRKIRQEKGLTLNQVANITNFTASYLSQIERNMTEPSISSLRKIAQAFNVPIYFFLSDEDEEEKFFIKTKDRKIMKLPKSNIFYEFLTPMPNEMDWQMKFVSGYFEIKPKKSASKDFFIHKTDEAIIILEGTMELILGEKHYFMEKGDSVYIKENIPHKMINNGNSTVKGIFIISPPVF